MESRMVKMQRRILEVVQQELQQWMDELLKDAFNPAKLMQFMRGMGLDMGQLSGMVGQPGFDPYSLLHLNRSASDEEVKTRYKEIMGKLHPDKAGEEMTELATIANAAYNIIRMERGF